MSANIIEWIGFKQQNYQKDINLYATEIRSAYNK